MDEKQSATLRAPFPDSLISLLPKVNCKACTDNKRDKHCDRHQMMKCRECGAWITSQHIHLNYVGHAETTDRFLDADPEWTWEPLAFDSDGLPKFDQHGGLWMRVTIAGVTKLGYGDAQGKTGPNAVKEAIGDGLRNAGIRFGVALDLWAKSDLASVHADKETGEIVSVPSRQADRSEAPAPAPATPPPDDEDSPQKRINTTKRRVKMLGEKLGKDLSDLESEFAEQYDGAALRDAGLLQLQTFADGLERLAANGSQVPA